MQREKPAAWLYSAVQHRLSLGVCSSAMDLADIAAPLPETRSGLWEFLMPGPQLGGCLVGKFLQLINHMTAGFLAVMMCALAWSPVAEAALRKVKCGKDDLQKVIAASFNDDMIELTGICLGNYRIDGKDLTLTGAAIAGPHGIQGVATDTAGLVISRSNKTVLQNLSFSDGAWQGVRAEYSQFTMSNCTVSRNAHNGVNVAHSSRLDGDHLLFEANVRSALGAGGGSYADCLECDFIDNLRWAAFSNSNSLVTLLDSVVTGRNGLQSSSHSYIDIDCASFETTHPCSLNAAQLAGLAFEDSVLAFYGAGNFWGQVVADGRSEAQLLGASQQSTGQANPPTNVTPRSNSISGGASLQVAPYDDGVAPPLASRLMGTTNVSGFSHALLYGEGGSTVLDGSLNCDSAGDAWKDAFVVLAAGASINGCEHAP